MTDISLTTILYISFYTSIISFGGGYLSLPLLEEEYYNKRKLISQNRIREIAAMAQSSPGAIAINLSAGLAYELKGIKGLFIALIGSVTPPFFIIIIVSKIPRIMFSYPLMISIFEGLDLAVITIMLSLNITMASSLFKNQGLLNLSFTFSMILITIYFNLPYYIVIITLYLYLKIKILLRGLTL